MNYPFEKVDVQCLKAIKLKQQYRKKTFKGDVPLKYLYPVQKWQMTANSGLVFFQKFFFESQLNCLKQVCFKNLINQGSGKHRAISYFTLPKTKPQSGVFSFTWLQTKLQASLWSSTLLIWTKCDMDKQIIVAIYSVQRQLTVWLCMWPNKTCWMLTARKKCTFPIYKSLVLSFQ